MENEPVVDNLLTEKPEGQTQTTPWYSDTYKDVVAKKGWKSGDDALKSYTELEKSMGSRVKMPTPESSADEIRAFYQKAGCPENPEGYEVKVPEGAIRDEDTEKWARQQLYEDGASKQLGEKLISGFYEQQVAALQRSKEQGEAQLRQELGAKYDTEITVAQRFCGNCSDEFRDLLQKTGLGNNPIFVKEFINLGKKTMADSIIKGDKDGNKEEEYVPKFKDSPSMYSTGEDDESRKAREYFTRVKGYKY